MKHLLRILPALISLVLVAALPLTGGVNAAATAKSLSTNFTLVNLGTSDANVIVSYYKDTGATWTAAAANTSFSIGKNGGQQIVRQYTDGTLDSGRGSAVISSDQPLASVVQIQARGQTPTSGGYSGLPKGANVVYVPQVFANHMTGSGLANTQLIIQNMDTTSMDVTVDFYASGQSAKTHSKTISGIGVGASNYYDLSTDSGLGDFLGSVVLTGGSSKLLGVVVNNFFGADGLQTYTGFTSDSFASKWFIPLFISKLPNKLSIPVSIQNVSGSQIGVGEVSLVCTRDPNSTAGNATYTWTNLTTIGDRALYSWNPVNPSTGETYPDSWQGSCTIQTNPAKNIVSFAQLRFVGNPDNGSSAAYEAIPAPADANVATELFIPLVAKKLLKTDGSLNFGTTATIQNLSDQDATVTLYYTHSAEVAGIQDYTFPNVTIPGSQSLFRNYKLDGAIADNLPDNWQGSLRIVSNKAIQGMIQMAFLTPSSGDSYMAHIAFTK